jgi:uncharacterized protein YbjT (DUF2867 family)
MILVTGATGKVGRSVVSQLLDEGQQVRVLTRHPARAAFPGEVEVVAGDLGQPGTLPAAIEGTQRAFLFPVHGRLHAFLDLARGSRLDRVVLLSSAAVTMPHPNAIARVHLDSEHVTASAGLPWTFVRPTAFMANDLAWAPAIKSHGVVRAPYGKAVTVPIDERDIAAVAVSALLHDGHAGRSYTITGPEPLTQIDRVYQLAGVLQRPLHFEEQAPGEFRQQMSTMPAHVTDSLLELLASRVDATPEITDTVQQVTGRPPRTYRQWAARHATDFSKTP